MCCAGERDAVSDDDRAASVECPCCGDEAANGYMVDGQALDCGCKGSISCDESEIYANVDDCDCDGDGGHEARALLRAELAQVRQQGAWWEMRRPRGQLSGTATGMRWRHMTCGTGSSATITTVRLRGPSGGHLLRPSPLGTAGLAPHPRRDLSE